MAWARRITRVLLLLAPLVGITSAFGDEVVTDIVFLIDISASMQQVQVGQGRTITFPQVIQRLQGFVDAGLPPNSNVTIITFGEQAANVQQIQVKDAEGRKRLQAALGRIKAEDQHTYMSQGIWYGLWEVQRLKKEFPSHYRLLFLITDGQNNPPSGKEPPISFDQLRAGIGKQLHLTPDEDFYFWYAHFGDSDAEVQRLTNDWQGERKPFDGDWRIGRFSFDRRTIRLPVQLPGEWVAAFPGKADLDRGETLGVEGYGVDGKELRLGPVVVPGLPASAQVRVSPQTVSLTDKYQQVSLELRGTNIPPGKYTGRVQLKPPPGFVIPSPRFFHLDFQVAQPTVLVEPAEKVTFGAVTPAAKGRAQIVLKPDVAAALSKPTIQTLVQLRETPPGLVVQAEPATVVLTERQSVRLTAAVERGHGTKPGAVAGKLVLKSSNPYLTFDPAEVPLTLDIQPWIVPLVRSEFFVEPKEDGTFELSLPVKSDALPAGTEAAFSLGVPKPTTEGPTTAPPLDLRVTGKAFTAAKPTARINGKIGSQPGKWSYEVPVLSADPLVVFEPTSIRIATSVVKAEVDVIPGDKLDFGTVAPGGESVREIYLSPSEAAAAVATTISMTSETALPKGASLEIDPPQVVVKGRTTVHVKLRLAADAVAIGELKGAIRLKVADQAVALAHDRLPWQAKTAKAVVDVIPGDKLDFGMLEPGQRQTRSLWLAPNEAAAVKKPTVRLAADGLPAGASVSFKPQAIVVDQKQEVKVTLVAGSELGQQKARLKLTSESPDVELAVFQLTAVYGAETGWIKFDVERLDYPGLLPGDSTPELRLRVAASQGAIGDTVRLAWHFGKLPPGMSVVPSVKQVTISQAGQEVAVPLVLKGAVGGDYEGTVKLTAESRVLPAELPVQIHVMERLVELVDVPEEWLIKVSTFLPRGTRECPFVLRANPAAAGATVSFRFAGETREGIEVAAQQESYKVSAGDNPGVLTAVIDLRPGFFRQTYTGTVNLAADLPQTMVRPAALTWKVVVPPLWPWLMVATASLALIVWLLWPPVPSPLCALVLQQKPANTVVVFQGAQKEPGQRLAIGALRKRNVYVGSMKGLAHPGAKAGRASDVVIQQDPGARSPHARIFRKGQQHWIEAIHALAMVGERSRNVGTGQRETLYDGDEFRIGDVVFQFRCPGAVRPLKRNHRRG